MFNEKTDIKVGDRVTVGGNDEEMSRGKVARKITNSSSYGFFVSYVLENGETVESGSIIKVNGAWIVP